MNLAEFFVKIGLAGSKEVAKGLTDVDQKLESVASSSLATKAAIAGVVYGLERLTGWASQAGMDIYKFGVTTGLSTDELQKLQYQAMKFDVSGDEVISTVKGIQQAMTDMQLHGGMSGDFGVMARMVQLDPKRINDTFYVLNKLKEFANKAPPNVANTMLKSMHVSDNFHQMLVLSNNEIDKLSKKDILSKKQLKQLYDVNIAWKKFWFDLGMLGKKFVAENGLGGVEALRNAMKPILDLATAISDLSKQSMTLKAVLIGIALAILAAFAPVTAVVIAATAALDQFQKLREGKQNVISDVANPEKGMTSWKALIPAPLKLGAMALQSAFGKTPEAGAAGGAGGDVTQNNVINIDGSDSPKETANAVVREINKAARKTPAVAGSY